jgi:hypothetical protein
MPTRGHYFFIVQGPSQTYNDDAGAWFWEAKSARTHAEVLIEDLKSDGKFDFRDWLMIVKNEDGRTVFSMPIYAAGVDGPRHSHSPRRLC